MYAEGGYVMIFGVLLSLSFIALGVWYFNKMIDSGLNQKAWLTRFISLLLAAMLGLFIVDKLVSFHTPLLTEEMSNSLFELIKNIVLVVFGYQFNDKTQ
jgi:uncharacterized membrane protein